MKLKALTPHCESRFDCAETSAGNSFRVIRRSTARFDTGQTNHTTDRSRAEISALAASCDLDFLKQRLTECRLNRQCREFSRKGVPFSNTRTPSLPAPRMEIVEASESAETSNGHARHAFKRLLVSVIERFAGLPLDRELSKKPSGRSGISPGITELSST